MRREPGLSGWSSLPTLFPDVTFLTCALYLRAVWP